MEGHAGHAGGQNGERNGAGARDAGAHRLYGKRLYAIGAAGSCGGNHHGGDRVEVAHLAPTPEGARIVVTATLTETDGRRFVYRVEAEDGSGKIGEGTWNAGVSVSRRLRKRQRRGTRHKMPGQRRIFPAETTGKENKQQTGKENKVSVEMHRDFEYNVKLSFLFGRTVHRERGGLIAGALLYAGLQGQSIRDAGHDALYG